MNKKGVEILGVELVNLIMAVLVLSVLIGAGVYAYLTFSTSSNTQKAKDTLSYITSNLDRIEEGKSIDLLILQGKGWHMHYSEDLCEGEFCFCLCSEVSCYADGAKKVCESIDRSVLLRAITVEKGKLDDEKAVNSAYKDARGSLAIPDKLPVTAKITKNNYNIHELSVGRDVVPIYFRFYEGKWQWSANFENWRNVSDEVVLDSREYMDLKIKSFIEEKMSEKADNEKGGGELLVAFGAKASKGAYTIDIVTEEEDISTFGT